MYNVKAQWDEVKVLPLENKNSWRAETIEFILIKEDDRGADVKKLYA